MRGRVGRGRAAGGACDGPAGGVGDRPAGDRPGRAAAQRHPRPDRGDEAEQGLRHPGGDRRPRRRASPPPGNAMLDVTQAWQYSTGAGVTVALIDTGVTPNPRFPSLFRRRGLCDGAARRRADRLREPRHRRCLHHRRGTVEPGGSAHPAPGRRPARRPRRRTCRPTRHRPSRRRHRRNRPR